MITVRFQSGFSVQYNSATCASNPDSDGNVRLYPSSTDREAGTNVIARVYKECLIEFKSPCRTYQAMGEEYKLEIRALQHKLDLARKQIQRLKKG